MLPTPNLDDQTFSDIVEEAVKSIPTIDPEWTDHNAHDPGITMIELFAWYKEMQQYHLNCSTERAMDMYLKLLGMERGDIAPARAVIEFAGLKEKIRLRAGDELTLSGGATFTFEEDARVGAEEVRALLVEDGELADLSELILKDHLSLDVFRAPGARLWIGVRRTRAQDELSLLVGVADDYPVPRNPFAPGQAPGRALRFTGADGRELPVLRDETHALSETGCLMLDVRGQADSDPVGRGRMLWVCAELTDRGCEERPRLMGMSASFARVTQKKVLVRHTDALAETRDVRVAREGLLEREGKCFLLARDAHGWRAVSGLRYAPDAVTAALSFDPAQDGRPNVRAIFYAEWMAPYLTADGMGRGGLIWPLPLGEEQPDVGSLRVMGLRSTPGGMRYVEWDYAPSLDALTPFDRRFSFDPGGRGLAFGDNLRGEAAPRGADALVLTDFALTLAGQGRIPAQQRLELDGQPIAARVALFEEGRSRENTQAVRARLMRKLQDVSRAVTEADYAAIARRTPGLRVMRAGAIAGYDPDRLQPSPRCVTVVALPCGQDEPPMPDRRFLDCVQRHLDRARPICTRVKVVAPLYIRLRVSATLVAAPGAGDVEANVRAALTAALRSDEKGWRLGGRLTEAEIAGVIGQAEGVLGVKTLSMTAESARAGRTESGDIVLPPHALPLLGALEVRL